MKYLVQKIAERVGLLFISRYINRNTPKIIMFHRISDDPMLNGIDLNIFEKQLLLMKKKYRVVSMNQLVSELLSQKIVPYTIAITFDDGYNDFLKNAWPKLKKYDLPTTLYVPTDFIDKSQWLWPDIIKYVLINAAPNTTISTEVGSFFLKDNNWLNIWSKLADYCMKISDSQRNLFIENLSTELCVLPPEKPVPNFESVTWEQLKQMSAEGLDIGSHTVTHQKLSSLKQEEVDFELQQSFFRIKEMIGKAPSGICYPYGNLNDINDGVTNSAEEKGYKYGVLACCRSVDKDNIYTIGRFSATEKLMDFKWKLSGLEIIN